MKRPTFPPNFFLKTIHKLFQIRNRIQPSGLTFPMGGSQTRHSKWALIHFVFLPSTFQARREKPHRTETFFFFLSVGAEPPKFVTQTKKHFQHTTFFTTDSPFRDSSEVHAVGQKSSARTCTR